MNTTRITIPTKATLRKIKLGTLSCKVCGTQITKEQWFRAVYDSRKGEIVFCSHKCHDKFYETESLMK